MTIAEFWCKVDEIVKAHRDRHIATNLTGEEEYENVSDFLVDVDSLSSAWHNRENNREGK